MNIRQIETFLAVAESGSFRRAAELLHRSQSVVSVHVQQLEVELGVPLLERTTRRVSLTAEGRTLLVRCKGVMADLKDVAQQLRDESRARASGFEPIVLRSSGQRPLEGRSCLGLADTCPAQGAALA